MRYVSRRVVVSIVLAIVLGLNLYLLWSLVREGADPAGAGREGGARSSASARTSRSPTMNAFTSETGGVTTNDPGAGTTSSRHRIQLTHTSYFARPFEAVQVSGTYRGTGQRTRLRLQLQDGREWISFPLPATTDRAGRFTAHLEWGAVGRYRLRVVDPRTRSVSRVATLLIL